METQRKMKNILALVAVAGALVATNAQATPIRLDGPETNLQTILNDQPGTTDIDVTTDQALLDEGFVLSGYKGMAEIIVEHAGYRNLNSFGIYDILDPSKRTTIFSGSAGAGAYKSFWPTDFTSDLFGFYLDTPDGIWFSQGSRNSDGADHMVAYELGGDYIFGWEDLSSRRWDQDYNDFVVLISGVDGVSVPEPATLGLLGLGIFGMGVFRRRKQAA
jgi:hypothetical protein